VMGIVADICYEWSKSFIVGGISPLYFAAFFVSLVYFIFWNGKTQFFERSLAVIVAVMSACFLINFFIMMPPPIDIVKGLIPSIPDVSSDTSKGPSLVIASMIGTTVFSGLFIIRTFSWLFCNSYICNRTYRRWCFISISKRINAALALM